MKIVYLLPSSGIAGGHRVVFQQSEALSELGQSVTVACPEPAPTWFSLKDTHWEQTLFPNSNAMTQADICVATYWTTVGAAVDYFRGPVFHLCQGYEADLSFNASRLEEIEAAYSQHTHKLVVSPHLATRLKSIGYGPVTYVGQAFDPGEFPPAERRRFDRQPPTVLVIGIFEADVKGIRETIFALAALRDMGISFRLHRISTWPLSSEEKSILAPDIYQQNLLPSEMGLAYRNADLFIGPSHPEEGFGLPVLEALSSGLPVLLSDTPTHRHIAGPLARYYPCNDISALALSARKMLERSELRAELSEKGPGQAARFETRTVAQRLMEIFSTY